MDGANVRFRSSFLLVAAITGLAIVLALATEDPSLSSPRAPDDLESRELVGDRSEHRRLQVDWISEVCVPATDDERFCTRFAWSEAWPWDSDDPLSELEQVYSERRYCSQWPAQGDAHRFCEALVAHYHRS
jgi:hypothetical protein